MKNLLWIDHSYHKKTNSSNFFAKEFLKDYFVIDFFFDESWKKGQKPDYSSIDFEKYDTVILWQILPDDFVLNSIKNKNVIFIPMYDGVKDWGFKKWKKVKDFKILCFSKYLYDYLNGYNFDTEYIKYYTKPQEYCENCKKSVFLWQRVSKINLNTVKKLVGNYVDKIHIHKVADPTHKELSLSKNDIEKYNITFTNWFDNQDEFLDVIKNSEIFIAPRFTEGIGMPLLEAMAMGKVIIANNAPTMNEYIQNGVNGYLCDFRHPKKIDFSDIEQVKQNAYKSSVEGYENFLNNKKRVIDFIFKNKEKNTNLFSMALKSFFSGICSFKYKDGNYKLSLFFISFKF